MEDMDDDMAHISPRHHMWDFRDDAGQGREWEGSVKDKHSDLKATLKGGAKRTEEGLVLDGKSGYAEIDNWEWGGTTSIEFSVKYSSLDTNFAMVFAFGMESGIGELRRRVYGAGPAGAVLIPFSLRSPLR